VSAYRAPNAARKRQIKASLIRRDGLACFYCGTSFADATAATIDHLVPRSIMPGWRLANLVLACLPCNQAKADSLPQAFLRPVGYGPGLVPLSGALSGALHSGAHLALAGAA
jgi:5-methylcytosine-specific restriction endonuclease McrA